MTSICHKEGVYFPSEQRARMKKILILTAGFGEGHNTAARNIRDGLESLGDEVQVEVLDLFESTYGSINQFARKAYLAAVNMTPKLWQSVYDFVDQSSLFENGSTILHKLQNNLRDLLHRTQPDVVLSTYPVYNHLIQEIYKNRHDRSFIQMTFITDSISINSIWYRTPCDYFLVANPETASVLENAGVSSEKIKVFGFPVPLYFADHPESQSRYHLQNGEDPKILYILNSGKKKTSATLERLLEHSEWKLTIVVGRDVKLFREITDQTKLYRDRVSVLGWTNKLPELMMSHHVIVSKAGGATVQESIAACTPMIVNQVIPGQEEGNWTLLEKSGSGAYARSPEEVEFWLKRCFEKKGKLWFDWNRALKKISTPESSIRIAEFILGHAEPEVVAHPRLKTSLDSTNGFYISKSTLSSSKQLLLCDFHTHTTYSDGKLTPHELVDFYGQRGFDCLAITDHYCDPEKVIGKICNLSGLVMLPSQVTEYFEVLERERKRAWKKYSMLLMTGIEFNKDGFRKKSSAHLLGIDLHSPIDPRLDIQSTIHEIHQQKGLAVASHPHEFSSHWGKNTMHLWENQEIYAPLLDAWEIANRDDLFNPIGLKRLPFLANSDFHKPKHISSWKTLVYAHKDSDSIKACIRENRDIALTLYRDHRFGSDQTLPEENASFVPSSRLLRVEQPIEN